LSKKKGRAVVGVKEPCKYQGWRQIRTSVTTRKARPINPVTPETYLIPRYAKYLLHRPTQTRHPFHQPHTVTEPGWEIAVRQINEVWPVSIRLEPGMRIKLLRDRPDIGVATHGRYSLIEITQKDSHEKDHKTSSQNLSNQEVAHSCG
jgi:hypothetical protein